MGMLEDLDPVPGTVGLQQGGVSKGQCWLSTVTKHRGGVGGGDKAGQGDMCLAPCFAGWGWELVKTLLLLQDTSADLALFSQYCGPAGLEQPH